MGERKPVVTSQIAAIAHVTREGEERDGYPRAYCRPGEGGEPDERERERGKKRNREREGVRGKGSTERDIVQNGGREGEERKH